MSRKSRDASFHRALLSRSRQLRGEGTPAEAQLWEILRDRKVAGLKFRRQAVLGRFVADFFCAEIKLVIELDGPVHAESADRDTAREKVLEAGGLTVLRFTNDAVSNDTKSVIQRIVSLASQLRAKPQEPRA